MHIIIEHMSMTFRHRHMYAGARISCDGGQSWVVSCKRAEGLRFKKDEVKSFETRHREVSVSEYYQRVQRVLNYGMSSDVK